MLVSTVDDWRKALDEDKLVGSIMVDLSKAFDTVSHPILHRKLSRYGSKGGELIDKWFDDNLEGRKQKVCVVERFSQNRVKSGEEFHKDQFLDHCSSPSMPTTCHRWCRVRSSSMRMIRLCTVLVTSQRICQIV